MHYQTKDKAKEKSTSFYLSKKLLEKIDFIANLERQSRSIIIETCINFYVKGTNNENFTNTKRKYYKKPRKKPRKNKKKFFISQENKQNLFEDEARQ